MASYTHHTHAKTTSAHVVAKPAQKNLLHKAPLSIHTLRSQALLQRAAEEPLSLTRADLQLLRATAGPATIQRLLDHPDVRQARRFPVPVPTFHPLDQSESTHEPAPTIPQGAVAHANGQVIQRMPVPYDKKSKDGLLYLKWQGIVGDFNKENKGSQFNFDTEWASAKDIGTFITRFKAKQKKVAEGPTQKESKDSIPENSMANYKAPKTITTPSKPKANKEKKNNDITASVLSSGPTTTQQTVRVVKPATNPLIQGWINNRPNGATITEGKIEVSEDTVYLYAKVDIPNYTEDYPQVDVYEIQTHYHPVPTTNNYLHVKHSAGGDAGNIVGPDCWLIPRGRASLRDAVQKWNTDYPEYQSQHQW